MENSTTLQNYELEQQICHQKEVNEKLLRRYIISQTRSSFGGQFALFALCLLFVTLGVFANLQLGLKWQVIVATCSTILIWGLYNLIITLPLTKGNLTTTSIQNLQPTLLRYKKCDLIGTAILLPILTALLIWLAFELYDLFTDHFWVSETDKRKGIVASSYTIIFTLLIVIGGICSTYSGTKAIDDLVADIEECKLE